MSNIDDFTLSYNLGKAYIKFFFKRFYREFIVVGKENIPTDCPVIFAPNHLNSVMDAIAVVSVVQQNMPVVFLARSDIFKGNLAKKVLRFIKIMPAFRMVDGIENLQKNQDTFDQCVEILHRGNCIGIMPEGNQGEQRKLRPIKKGIFRVAFAAQKKWGNQPMVKIVPIGIDLGDLTKARKHIIISIGKPIEVSDYMAELETDGVRATNKVKEKLRASLSEMTLDLATDNHYPCFESATEIANNEALKCINAEDNTLNRFIARQWIGKRLVSMIKNSPSKIEKLEQFVLTYTQLCNELNIKPWTVDEACSSSPSLIIDVVILLLSSPVFVIGYLLNLIPFFLPVAVTKTINPGYDGFLTSIHFGLGLFTFPIFYVAQTYLFYGITGCYWEFLPMFFVGQYYLGKLAYEWYRNWKKLMGRLRVARLEKSQDEKFIHLKQTHKELIELILRD